MAVLGHVLDWGAVEALKTLHQWDGSDVELPADVNPQRAFAVDRTAAPRGKRALRRIDFQASHKMIGPHVFTPAHHPESRINTSEILGATHLAEDFLYSDPVRFTHSVTSPPQTNRHQILEPVDPT